MPVVHLNDCPFCGGSDVGIYPRDAKFGGFFVMCHDERCGSAIGGPTLTIAIEKWEQRKGSEIVQMVYQLDYLVSVILGLDSFLFPDGSHWFVQEE